MKQDLKNTFWLTIPVMLAIYAVSYIFGMLNVGVSQLFSSVSVYQTITPTLGNKIVSFMTGIVPLNFSLPNILVLFLSAFATLLVGNFLLSKTGWSFLGKTKTGKLASTIFWGGLVVYFVLVGFTTSGLTMGVIIGSLIWILAVSYLAGLIGGWMKKV